MKTIIKKSVIPNVIYAEDVTAFDSCKIFTLKEGKRCVIRRLGVWYYWYYEDNCTIADEKVRGGSVRDLVENTCGSNANGFEGVFMK